MNISIIGTGYVGLVSGACLAEMGHRVWCVDRDREKIDSIAAGKTPIHEAGLEELLKKNVAGGNAAGAEEGAVFPSAGTSGESTDSPSSGTPGEGRGGGLREESSDMRLTPTLTLPRSTGGGDKRGAVRGEPRGAGGGDKRDAVRGEPRGAGGGVLYATTDLEDAVLRSELTLIAVGTPFDGRRIDLTFIRQTARQIGEALAKKNAYHVVVVKSTVVPGTTEGVVLPILEQASGRCAGRDFGVGMNPEFLSEGSAVADFMSPDRIVLGGIDRRTTDAMGEMYAAFDGRVPRVVTTIKTAEMIKYVSNALQATMISFANEMGNLCAAMGQVDIVDVMRGVHLMGPLMPRGADGRAVAAGITHFLHAGCGFGGSCFPKDLKALAAQARQIKAPADLLQAVLAVNAAQPLKVVELLEQNLGRPPAGAKVAVLGVAFKPGTDDLRESPAIAVIEELLKRGATVNAYDPAAGENARKLFGTRVRIDSDLESAIDGVDAIAILTRWEEFADVPRRIAVRKDSPLVVDGRRMLERDSVARYAGIGRSGGHKGAEQ